MSTQNYVSLYNMTLHQPDTNQTEIHHIFLFKREYAKMVRTINEIVYVDEDNKEWALKEIKPIKEK
jgi:hypothetical protein